MRTHLVAAAVAALSLAALAADPADPSTAGPRTEYRSVFEGVPTGVEEQTVDWRKANADVAQFPRGHVDLLKWEGAQSAGAAPARPAASAPARAASAPARAASAAARPQAPAGHRH